MRIAIIPFIFIFLSIFICIPVLIGVYVYRDAKSRNMNAALWTLITILAPALIGFIIYLLVRGSYSDMKCPKCEANVTEQYISCPNCGAKLKAACPNCSFPVEEGWNVCPRCAAPLPERYDNISAPTRKKDRTLSKILLAVILIPLLLIIVMFVSFYAFSFTGTSGGTGVTSLPVDEYLQEVNNPQIEEWLETCEEDYSKAYILWQESSYGAETEVHYLIYMPRLVEQPEMSIGQTTGLSGPALKLEFSDSNGNTGNTLLLVSWRGETAPKLNLYYDGISVDCEFTEVDYPLELMDYK